MFAAERRQVILELVRSNGAVSLRELARIVKTSEVTVRRDLRHLEAEGMLARRHGGAVANDRTAYEPSYTEKAGVASDEKAAIADLAAELVAPGDAIVIGAGTTTQALAKRLARLPELTVVTNSLLVTQAFARSPGIEVMVTGGLLRGSIYALVGSSAEESLATLRVQRAFLSSNGLTAARGMSTPNAGVAGIDRAMAAAATEVVALVDNTKIGVDTMVQTVPAARISHVVTDSRADPAELAALRASGVKIYIA
ncbi:DeoR/GlpR family transcriptional regulator of sugar metabolism [Kibdelosporangium banguiense]|uniref:DeoR/GlpR family transcriptional regulator of sugar metabolism n=1 Tax=Kibdelosporangium banguiense TaxID=1365924 RepID=A0ABS4THF7_9PSEU|nr:DeoR/GlpR family DNA-binding transcription regulator [Kibdelosporangium banguiense]MBP2323872.1 DeoR/GlpR family transcriptional regulator of sugar metabolism [Kibdelosporangium banguiense]